MRGHLVDIPSSSPFDLGAVCRAGRVSSLKGAWSTVRRSHARRAGQQHGGAVCSMVRLDWRLFHLDEGPPPRRRTSTAPRGRKLGTSRPLAKTLRGVGPAAGSAGIWLCKNRIATVSSTTAVAPPSRRRRTFRVSTQYAAIAAREHAQHRVVEAATRISTSAERADRGRSQNGFAHVAAQLLLQTVWSTSEKKRLRPGRANMSVTGRKKNRRLSAKLLQREFTAGSGSAPWDWDRCPCGYVV